MLASLSSPADGHWRPPEAVCPDGLGLEVLDVLGSLVDHSLVRQEETQDGELRFLMLETIREYAAERLGESGKEEEIRRRHAEHFRDLAEEAELHLIHADRIHWLTRLEADHGHPDRVANVVSVFGTGRRA